MNHKLMINIGTHEEEPLALNDVETRNFNSKLNDYVEETVEVPRMKIGNGQSIETLINEEALLFSKHLKNEKKDWFPRIGINKR